MPPQDYSGQNLRGRSFKNQNLEGANFSGADIRSADFSGANLTGANFSHAKAGLQKRWAIFLVVVSWLLSGISGFFSSFAGAFVVSLLFNSSKNHLEQISYHIAGLGAIILIIIFFLVTIRKGIQAGFAAFTAAFAFTGAVAVAVVVAVAGAGAGPFAFAGAIAVAVAGAIAGAIAGAVAGAIAVAVAGAGAIAGAIAVAGAGAIAVAGAGPFTIAVAGPFTIAGAVAVTLLNIYIGWRAIKGDEKHALIRNIAVAFAAFGGTSIRKADLTDVKFTGATLKSTDFRKAILIRTCFSKTKKLEFARAGRTYLQKAQVREVLVTGLGKDKNFDREDLRGVNFTGANLQDASFIRTDLSKANLQDADLSRAKLIQAQLDGTDFTGATLTGAYIKDWGITSDTKFDGVRCEYVYMRQPTKEAPDPLRKPDNREEVFGDGEFGDFIKPIVDTLDLYHNQGVDPRAIAISFKELAENHPEAELEIVAMEKRGEDKFLLRAKTAENVDRSQLSAEYFETYNQIKSLPERDIKLLLAEKDSRIHSLENMIGTALQRPSFYAQNYQNQGNTAFSDHSSNDSTPKTNTAVKTILILASNPKNTSSLRLNEEIREIDAGLQRAKKREQFNLEQRWAVRTQDVYQALLDFKPQLVHFSGHGSGDDGLVLEDETGNVRLVDTVALTELFKLFASDIECVVLNACYSEVQASAIATNIPYVIGMNKAIGDKAAIKFATGFYNALCAGESVEFAYKLGCNVIQLDGIAEHLTPVLKMGDRSKPHPRF